MSLVFFLDSMKCIGFQIFRNMKKKKALEKTTSVVDEISPVESLEYDFNTIQNATNNFSEINKIGEGGFGAIYKGTLEDGQQVAVKRLFKELRKDNLEFKNEVALMTKLQHRNLVRLLGYCQEGKDMVLVYEFAPNGGLDNILFGNRSQTCLSLWFENLIPYLFS
nr:putative receptor-like protein kinase At4g00960 [Ipomoea batatas]